MNPDLENVASELRSWGGVAVVGAGLSVFAGMPSAFGLNALVWHAVDADPDAFAELKLRIGGAALSGKALIGDEPTRIALAYDIIRRFPQARRSFQEGFCQRNAERVAKPSPAHEALARLFHDGYVEIVASLNWDSLFEAAYERCYGRSPSVDNDIFYKPHGDVADPEQPWILPGQTGRIPSSLMHRLQEITREKPRVLLVIGYSESDEEVVRNLIAPMAARWRVARVGPTAKGEWSIRLPAEVAMPTLVDCISPVPRDPLWIPVVFGEQHDLGPALNGAGLGPRDIDALVALPETASIIAKLRSTHCALVTGLSGCGKSGTAFRVGRSFNEEGWEVVRLSKPTSNVRALASQLEDRRFPTLAIIDDAHRLEPPILDELLQRSSTRLKVLAVATAEQTAMRNEIRIDHTRAVRLIASKLERDRGQTLAAVHAMDSHVSDDYGGERLERRIEEALKAPTPWQFIFILTGGWRRVREHIISARAEQRADLLLLAIAASQLTSLDGPAEVAALGNAVRPLGFDQDWVTRSLLSLHKLRLITATEQPKCPHLRYANLVIRTMLDDRQDPLRGSILLLLNQRLSDVQVSLRGVYWLLEPMRFCDGLRGQYDQALTEATRESLILRCFAAALPFERSMAGYVLSHLGDFVPGWAQVLKEHIPIISRWVDEATGVSGWGLARFLNNIDQDNHEINTEVLASVNAKNFTQRISDIDTDEFAGFGDFLNRISWVGRDSFSHAVTANFVPAIIRAAAKRAVSNTYGFGMFLDAILCFDRGLAIQLADDNAESLAEAMAKAPLDTFEDIQRFIWFGLHFDMGLKAVPKPKPSQRKLAKRLCDRLDASACARAIEAARLGDLERWARFLFFLRRAQIRYARQIVAELDLQKLDTLLKRFWSNPPMELEDFVMEVAFRPDFEPARSWISTHVNDLQRIPFRFAIIAPNAVASALNNGDARIVYPSEMGFYWDLVTYAFASLTGVNKTLAERSMRTQVDAIARSLISQQANLYERADRFLSLLEEISPDILRSVVDHIDPELALKHWPKLTKGNSAQRRALEKLLEVASKNSGPIGNVPEAIRTRQQAKKPVSNI